MPRIAHISDIHFGRIAHPAVVQSLVDDINGSSPDVVVVSGDLTQRGLPKQYGRAARMLAAFDAPTLVVPGNHDVFAWWRPHTRLLDPLRRYREMITEDLSPRVQSEGLAVFGLNSAYGATVKGGRVRRDQLEEMTVWFDSVPAEALRVLVVHHHFQQLPGIYRHDIAKGSAAALQYVSDAGVDLILSGHLHVSCIAQFNIETGSALPGVREIIVSSAGTATSNRGRKSQRADNYYNVVDVTSAEILIQEKKFDAESNSWLPAQNRHFLRYRTG